LINLIFIWFIVAYLRQQIECFPQILEGIGVLMQRVPSNERGFRIRRFVSKAGIMDTRASLS